MIAWDHALCRAPEIRLSPDRLHLAGALNQIPTELLFRDGALVEERLGPLSYDDLAEWLGLPLAKSPPIR